MGHLLRCSHTAAEPGDEELASIANSNPSFEEGIILPWSLPSTALPLYCYFGLELWLEKVLTGDCAHAWLREMTAVLVTPLLRQNRSFSVHVHWKDSSPLDVMYIVQVLAWKVASKLAFVLFHSCSETSVVSAESEQPHHSATQWLSEAMCVCVKLPGLWILHLSNSRWSAADAEIEVSSAENPHQWVFSFIPGVGHKIALHASPAVVNLDSIVNDLSWWCASCGW